MMLTTSKPEHRTEPVTPAQREEKLREARELLRSYGLLDANGDLKPYVNSLGNWVFPTGTPNERRHRRLAAIRAEVKAPTTAALDAQAAVLKAERHRQRLKAAVEANRLSTDARVPWRPPLLIRVPSAAR